MSYLSHDDVESVTVSDPEVLGSFLGGPQLVSGSVLSCHLLCAFPVLLSLF